MSSEVSNSENVQETPQASQEPESTNVEQSPESTSEEVKKDVGEVLYPDQSKEAESGGDKPKEETPDEDGEKAADSGEGESKEEKPEGGDKDEEWSLSLPDGAHFSQDRLDEIAAEAREQGLSKEQAEALVDREQKAISTYIEGEKTALDTRSQNWVEEVKADKEIGGEKFGASVEFAKRVVSKYASDSLKEMLDETKLGNHPEVVRLFARLGKEMASDEFVNAPQGHVTKKEAKSHAERLYGNTTPN